MEERSVLWTTGFGLGAWVWCGTMVGLALVAPPIDNAVLSGAVG